jgi:hypothetical protein
VLQRIALEVDTQNPVRFGAARARFPVNVINRPEQLRSPEGQPRVGLPIAGSEVHVVNDNDVDAAMERAFGKFEAYVWASGRS